MGLAGDAGSERETRGSQPAAASQPAPKPRNDFVDFLRAASIVVVVLGHWLMAAPTVQSGVGFTLSDILRVAPGSRWLTWIFQVMPVFFAVGGYANAASLESANSRNVGYDAWLSRRLQRLVRPVAPFLLVWCLLGLSARWLGLGEQIVQSGSRAAFAPVWFLAVYVLVVVLAPPMHALWRRFGLASFWGLVMLVAIVDATAHLSTTEDIRWLNYVFVWLAIHQLGIAWRGGAFNESGRSVALAIAGLTALIVLEGLASYPVSMVTVPGPTPANASPPTLALLSLGVTHMGVALAMEARATAWLDRSWIRATAIALNRVIMTLYLWHATVMVLVVGLAEVLGGIGLRSVPGTTVWWAFRAPWVVVLLIGLNGFVAVFGRTEGRRPPADALLPAWRSVAGAVALCVGLVALAADGIGADSALGVRLLPMLLSLGGTALVIVAGARPEQRRRVGSSL
jgi:hypothetical protein